MNDSAICVCGHTRRQHTPETGLCLRCKFCPRFEDKFRWGQSFGEALGGWTIERGPDGLPTRMLWGPRRKESDE